ncbi:uncharacterized mitochondrial protein AtMg00810-like [Humulus lupulus]|uniref:uncharacterized mitochondrial protein AtMg00810-like n=1 Tax=Humulus lupulus TaxID=3486 RepID=UPI002B407484|nr:uncharacterized mitochondrial protein AtMg00810-like [Humulus lupulus]
MSVLIVYGDDIIVTGNHTEEIFLIKEMFAKEFEVKDLGTPRYFLGMEFARSKKGILVFQRKYTLGLLKETGMLGSKPSTTPIELGDKRKMFRGNSVDKGRYQQLVGKLIYLSHTRPEIAFATIERKVEVFIDADWVGSVDDRKSTSGYCTLVRGNVVTWRSKK